MRVMPSLTKASVPHHSLETGNGSPGSRGSLLWKTPLGNPGNVLSREPGLFRFMTDVWEPGTSGLSGSQGLDPWCRAKECPLRVGRLEVCLQNQISGQWCRQYFLSVHRAPAGGRLSVARVHEGSVCCVLGLSPGMGRSWVCNAAAGKFRPGSVTSSLNSHNQKIIKLQCFPEEVNLTPV